MGAETEDALREILEICENTPEGSKPEILDEALNEILDVCREKYKNIECGIIENSDKKPIKLKVFSCSRCGKDHYVNFFKFDYEGIKINGKTKQYWGMCPKKHEPILMHFEETK